MRRKSTVMMIFCVVATTIGAAAATAARRVKRSDDMLGSASIDKRPANGQQISANTTVPVRVFEVGSVKPNRGANTFTGTVRARYQTAVAFRVAGKILRRHVEVGAEVAAGQPLFDLDPGDYILQQKAAEANLAVAEAALQRTSRDEQRLTELRRLNAVSTADYEQSLSQRDIAIGQKESAAKQLELAVNQVAYCHIVAEQRGVVMSIDAEAGQVVSVGTRVCSLAQGGEYEAVIDIPENRIPIQPGTTGPSGIDAEVTFWSRPDVRTKARLRELSPIADTLSRTYQARFTLIEPPADIKLGMTATVSWATSADTQGLAVPVTAVFKRGSEAAVWVVDLDHGTLQPAIIKITVYGDEWVTVTAGLVPGQRIVSAGVQKLDEGVKVRVWEQQD